MRTIRNTRRTAGILTGILRRRRRAALPGVLRCARERLHPPRRRDHPVDNAVRLRTREATASASDGECVGGSSVWYRYRPTADEEPGR